MSLAGRCRVAGAVQREAELLAALNRLHIAQFYGLERVLPRPRW
jgi:hypothetical protein